MKFQTLMLMTHFVAAAGAGGACWAALSFQDVNIRAAAAAAAVVCAAGGAVLASVVFGRSLAPIETVAEGGAYQKSNAPPIRELELIAERLRENMDRWKENVSEARRRSRDMSELLAVLDQQNENGGALAHPGAGSFELRGILGSLAGNADADLRQILACSREIEESTEAIAAGADDQSDAVSKSTSYVEQMSENIDSVAGNAEAASKASQITRGSAETATGLVSELVEGISRIRNHVQASGKKLRGLGERSQEIGSIVETIAAISARTDMLALNASIESVRAGEHGRGFAVVADEVRKLAEQAAQATREVAELIESIQMETRESITVMDEEQRQVDAEARRADEARTALQQITQTSTESAGRVEDISRATQQQLRLMQEVVEAMERITDVARGIRSRAESVSWRTKTLTKLAGQLDISLGPLRHCSPAGARRGAEEIRTGTGGELEGPASGSLRKVDALLDGLSRTYPAGERPTGEEPAAAGVPPADSEKLQHA